MIIVDPICFHATGDAVPKRGSGYLGKPRGPVDPKREVVTKRKADPKIMKRVTNFLLVIFMCVV